ncbi:MarR family winged helix-turn-helix transcriptional regulator [Pseudoprimorskyibacter insulae]|uniref:Multidrug resistance operon repressor n=1 Tax=Pseudoprimorskyibacter insulae TaxID=1695997 RepID=A0A2R8AQT7_9RHOB|nr:MarR family transcriptional regulator [Pseudoprimorskyibacter insulae]SPF78199.1 Multidrug resistance operon repressor [Pseudoprimorskyibacter insulae]
MSQASQDNDARVRLGPLAQDLPFMVRNLQALLRPKGQAIRDKLDVEAGVIGVMSIIWLNPGVSQNDLAASVTLKKSAVTKLVKALEARGLLERRRQDSDRRLNALTLTAEGEALVAQVRADINVVHAELFEGVPQADQDTFFRVMGLLIDRLAPTADGAGPDAD